MDYIALAIRNYHDAGSDAFIQSPLASFASLLDRLGRFAPAATIAGFAALSPLTTAGFPELGIAIATYATSSATRYTNYVPERAKR
jgi:hypothetical protein